MSCAYCSTDCQKADWKRHKPECAKLSKALPVPVSLPAVSSMWFGYRMVTVADPPAEKVSCVCFCCGMLLKRVEGDDSNSGLDVDGHFMVKDPCNGDPYPAQRLLKEGQVGVRVHQLPSGERAVGACDACARSFLPAATAADRAARLRDCHAWLSHRTPPRHLPNLNIFEQRCLAIVSLYPAPDLSNGKLSFAGEFARSSREQPAKKVTYEYADLEEKAFPTLLCGSSGWSGGNIATLKHYTDMRLYSVDPRWRSNEDYVNFSLNRLAAFGDALVRSTLEQIPLSMPEEEGESVERFELDTKHF